MKKLLTGLLIPLVLQLLPLQAQASPAIILTPENTIVFRGVIDGGSATQVATDLINKAVKRGNKNYPLYLVLDSPGGSIEAGFMFVQIAKYISNLHTVSIFAASMASAIVEELPGQRYVTENGTLMFHKAAASVEGTVEVGSMESQMYYIKRRVLLLENGNASRMQLSLPDYKHLIANELWLDADDSVRYRAADRVVDLVCSASLIKQTITQSFQSFFGNVSFSFSACPLFRVPFSGGSEKVKYAYGPSAVTK